MNFDGLLIILLLKALCLKATEKAALESLVHLSYLRLKYAPSILWNQLKTKTKIHDEELEDEETQALCAWAHQEHNIVPTVTQAFFRAQNEGNLLLRYALLGSNLSHQPEPIIKNRETLHPYLDKLHKSMLVNLTQVENNLIAGDCRHDLGQAISKECDTFKLDELYSTALVRSLGYLIDICQLHRSWFTGSPEFKNIII